MFQEVVPKCLLESSTGCISQYKKEVQHFLFICIPGLAEGFELQQGKKHLELLSRKMVINKSVDLLHKADLTELKKYIKPAAEIKQVKIQWAEKIKQHLEKGYIEKEAANLKSRLNKVKFTGITKTRKSTRSIYFC